MLDYRVDQLDKQLGAEYDALEEEDASLNEQLLANSAALTALTATLNA